MSFAPLVLPIRIAVLALCALLAAPPAAAGGDRTRLARAYFSAAEEAPAARFSAWATLVISVRGLPRAEQLERVNQYFHENIRAVPDIELWGVTEYWATPMETLARGAGDCDDIAIGKFFTLLAAGVPAPQLRLYYVFASSTGGREMPHLVLGYLAEPDAEPLILDNLVMTIHDLKQRRDLDPVAAFASDAVYRLTRGQVARLPVHRSKRWAAVIARAHAEGFPVDLPPADPSR